MDDALEIDEKIPGSPDLAVTLNNLGQLAMEKQEFDNASKLYDRAIKILENSVKDKKNPQLAHLYHNQAAVFEEQGRYDQAKDLYGSATGGH